MVVHYKNPWEHTTRSGLVPAGDHNLYISISGPSRSPGSPVLIYFTGGGAPVALHVRLQRLLSEVIRVCFYDRSGYDQSEGIPGSKVVTARDNARELYTLLTEGVKVKPPYILVAHSYGGIIAREFLELCLKEHGPPGEQGCDPVQGIVLAETATELMYQLFPHIPPPALEKISQGVDYAEITHAREESGLTTSEWEKAMEAIQRTVPGAQREDNHASGRELAKLRQFERQVLGDNPLSVIRCDMTKDFRVLYKAGAERGQGTDEERVKAKEFIETLKLFDDEMRFSQTRLSASSRYRTFLEYGHDGVLRKPEIIVDEVKWILQSIHRRAEE
ncbi:alpha/beta fold hydrolase [Aspergillus stella-maris]|uniref:alpha/beta fold hydrolase n=1 Tax=Aspergillus stella-maris TaxID=1810926 RepID=UPI003CCDE014